MSSHEKLVEYARGAYSNKRDRNALSKYYGDEIVMNKGETFALRNDKEKKIYVAHRGTSRRKDLSADVAIALGVEKFHPRFQRAKRETKKLRKENPGFDIVHTGHSLGGSIAQQTGRQRDEIVTFNKGAGLFEPLRSRKRRQTDYINPLDPISHFSIGQRGGKQILSNRLWRLNPHSSKSFKFK